MILLIILVFTTIQSNTLSRIHLFLSSHLFFFVFIVVLFQTRQIFALQMYTMIILIMFGLVLVPFYMTICILEPSFFPSMIPMDYRQSSEETHLLSTLQSQLYQLCVYKLFREGCIEMWYKRIIHSLSLSRYSSYDATLLWRRKDPIFISTLFCLSSSLVFSHRWTFSEYIKLYERTTFVEEAYKTVQSLLLSRQYVSYAKQFHMVLNDYLNAYTQQTTLKKATLLMDLFELFYNHLYIEENKQILQQLYDDLTIFFELMNGIFIRIGMIYYSRGPVREYFIKIIIPLFFIIRFQTMFVYLLSLNRVLF